MNFSIEHSGPISNLFIANDCMDFEQAQQFIRQLPYARNTNKNNLPTIFIDKCGTCSTKHAVLKQLAIEQHKSEIKLIQGIFLMTIHNTPAIKQIFKKYNIEAIPEAHNYLKINNEIIDCTKTNWSANNFEKDVLEEIEIAPYQIADWKVNYHKTFLKNWLQQQNCEFSLANIWYIREICIAALSEKE